MHALKPEIRTASPPLVAICLGYFMVIMDATAVNLSLPQLGHELGGGTGALQWVIDAYTLTFASLLLSAGSLGDRFGAHRAFRVGIGVFVAASAACGLAGGTGTLIAARLVQGVGAALIVPSSLALLQLGRDRVARARAVGAWGGIAGIAAASGPVVGGVLTQAASWRLVFFINAPIGLAVLLPMIRRTAAPETRARGFDPFAQLAAVAALAALTFALIEARTRGWTSPLIDGGFVAAALLGVAFVVTERRVADPMLPLGLFRSRAFSGGGAVGLLINLGFYGQLFVTSLYLQDTRRMSPITAGLALLPEGILVSVGSFLSGRLSGRAGTRPTMLIGLCVGGAGLLGLVTAGPHTSYGILVVPLMAAGFGMSFTMPAATTTVVEAAPPDRAGIASGAINTGRQVGSTIGVALLGTLGASLGFPPAMAAAAGAFFAGALFVAAVVR
jgi:MFS transporter, DHA2 family, methylenomycin A resistance protein